MDWFLYVNGLRHERVKIRSEIWRQFLIKSSNIRKEKRLD